MGTNGERRGSAQLVLKLITFNSARLPPVPAGSSPPPQTPSLCYSGHAADLCPPTLGSARCWAPEGQAERLPVCGGKRPRRQRITCAGACGGEDRDCCSGWMGKRVTCLLVGKGWLKFREAVGREDISFEVGQRGGVGWASAGDPGWPSLG